MGTPARSFDEHSLAREPGYGSSGTDLNITDDFSGVSDACALIYCAAQGRLRLLRKLAPSYTERTCLGRALQTLNVEHAGHAFHRAYDSVEMLHIEDFDRHLYAPVII